jgi:hypothetical protein
MNEQEKTIQQLNTKIAELEKINGELQSEISEVIKLVRQIIGVLGLLDANGTSIKPELLSGEDSVFSLLLNSLSDIIGLITKSKLPIIGQRYEKKLEEQFAFVKDIVPIVQKYAIKQ